MKEIELNKIKELLDIYGIPDVGYERISLSNSIRIVIESSLYQNYLGEGNDHIVELVQIIKFLNSCDSNITIDGIITNPQDSQIKGTHLKLDINNNNFFIENFYLFANTLLANQEGLRFIEYINGWEPKKPYRYEVSELGESEVFEHPFYVEPYTDEELNKILDYHHKTKVKEIPDNAKLGRIAYGINYEFGYFKIKVNTQAKLYSFIYDVIRTFGIIGNKKVIYGNDFKGDLANAKWKNVDNWITAYIKANVP